MTHFKSNVGLHDKGEKIGASHKKSLASSHKKALSKSARRWINEVMQNVKKVPLIKAITINKLCMHLGRLHFVLFFMPRKMPTTCFACMQPRREYTPIFCMSRERWIFVLALN